jgi:hypothetical protein
MGITPFSKSKSFVPLNNLQVDLTAIASGIEENLFQAFSWRDPP